MEAELGTGQVLTAAATAAAAAELEDRRLPAVVALDVADRWLAGVVLRVDGGVAERCLWGLLAPDWLEGGVYGRPRVSDRAVEAERLVDERVMVERADGGVRERVLADVLDWILDVTDRVLVGVGTCAAGGITTRGLCVAGDVIK
jgi:hypothetical protein